METKLRYCSKCGSITVHSVISKNGIQAVLCKSCILGWAKLKVAKEQREAKADQQKKFQ